MKLAFAGTPKFGALVLGALLRSSHEVVLVLTQPDRPAGRGRGVRMSPVKELALRKGLRVEQPQNISTQEVVDLMHELGVRVLTIAAFGQILREPLLGAIPCINVHGSLLPEYRGAAPMERAIMEGRKETGVSIMEVKPALDSGQVYITKTVPIGPGDDAGMMYEKLAEAGGEALVETLDLLEAGELRGKPQDEGRVTYAEKIGIGDRHIDWHRPAQEITDQVRGLSPHIGAFTSADGHRLKIWKARPAPEAGRTAPARDAEGREGKVQAAGRVEIDGSRLLVHTGEGLLQIIELQPEGKRRMSAADFLRGYRRLVEGARLE